jgi:NAD-dependent SIR2 family protein deacetylase
VADLTDVVTTLGGRRTIVLTGAGVSTDSGIPDYRGPDSPPRSPMTIAQFRSGPDARRRYWARSHLGWQTMTQVEPNDGHRAIADLEYNGAVFALVTQNVDGLHRKAGSRNVVELHGRLADVRCLDCGTISSRRELHERLDELNPDFAAGADIESAPDGDAMLEDVDGFTVADCTVCGGVLKPDVVFFGENVPKPRVAHCFALVDTAEAMLVAGSSLTVLSGLRFVRHAHSQGKPVVIVNRGATRADDLATIKVDAGTTESLVELGRRLGSSVVGAARQAVPSEPSHRS